MKRLLLAPLILSLCSPVLAGIPESRVGKWVLVKDTPLGKHSIDTEDVEIKGSKMRFWVRREQGLEEPSDSNTQLNWAGKMRINCKDFTLRIDLPTYSGLGTYQKWEMGKLQEGDFAYELANQFCFLTGEEGYTPEPNPEPWVEKIIQTVQSK